MLFPTIDFNTFPIYNIMGGIGLVLGFLLLDYNLKFLSDKNNKKQNFIIYVGLALIFALPLASLFNYFIYPSPKKFISIFNIINYYGFTFYFGLIAFVCIMAIIIKFNKYAITTYANALIPSITITHAMGRLGCSFVGCCYGVPIKFKVFGLFRFPARELEALFLFLLTFIFIFVIKKSRYWFYFISYAVFRFGIEFFRGDNRGHLLTKSLSPSQEISLFVLFFTIVTFSILRLKKKYNQHTRYYSLKEVQG